MRDHSVQRDNNDRAQGETEERSDNNAWSVCGGPLGRELFLAGPGWPRC